MLHRQALLECYYIQMERLQWENWNHHFSRKVFFLPVTPLFPRWTRDIHAIFPNRLQVVDLTGHACKCKHFKSELWFFNCYKRKEMSSVVPKDTQIVIRYRRPQKTVLNKATICKDKIHSILVLLYVIYTAL